jgi:PelA/Pel-15E family pectate lyase
MRKLMMTFNSLSNRAGELQKVTRLALLPVLGFIGAVAAFAAVPSMASNPARAELPPINTSGFLDSAHHWRHIRDPNRFIQALPNQPSYAPAQVREIAANILLFQRENGGWPKDYDMTAVLTEEQKAVVRATRDRTDTSFDNGNLHSQVAYLARAYTAAGEPAWRDACLRGLDFILAAQYPNGGFPQRYPNPKDFRAHITFNDYVMIGILNVMQDVAGDSPDFAWLDATRRDRVREAVGRGVECILKCQIRVDGKLTGWCQQHDEKTYEARPARGFELASICPQDTSHIVRFLMRSETPGDDVVRAVDAAVEWMRRVKLSGIRVERVKAPPEKFEKYDADFDVVVMEDAQASPLWARHYEISTGRPIFAGYDAVKRYALAEIPRERRTGTAWYGNWPQTLLEQDYPQWRAKVRGGKTQSPGKAPPVAS